MKSICGIGLALSLTVGVLVFAVPSTAEAAPGDGCAAQVVNNTTGGPTMWTGVISLKYTPPVGQSATVSCELFVNGSSRGTKLGPTSGTGVVVAAGPLTYTAAGNAVVILCMHIVVGGVPQSDICTEPPEPTPIPPDEVVELIDTVVALVNSLAESLDPLLCSALRTAAPVVNALGQPQIVRIDPTYGDVYLFDAPFWDCPPYGS